MAENENILGTGPLKKLMLKLAIPSIVAQLIYILYNIVDKMYIGRLPGTEGLALAGLGICTPLILIVSSFSMLVCGGGAPIAAIYLGKNEKDKSDLILGISMFLLLVIGSVLTIVSFIFQAPLLRLFGASEAIFPYAKSYFSVYLWGTIFVQIALGLNTFIAAQGKARIAMITVTLGAITNIILDPIFIFGLKLGVRGAAVATVISQALSMVFVLRFLVSNDSIIRLRRKNIVFVPHHAKEILELGVSPFIMQATESAIILVFNRQLLNYGNETYIGTLAILQSVMQLLFVPILGFTTGVQPIMSYNYGAKKNKRVTDTVITSIIITLIISIVYNSCAALFPRFFGQLFTDEVALLDQTQKYLPVFMIGMWFFPIQMVTQSFLVGTNQPKISLFIALLRKVILLIPLTLLLPLWWGVNGIFYSEPIADLISVTVSAVILILSMKKIKEFREFSEEQ